jgi:putative DNA base modification enzyme with NMAD domain
LLSGSSKYLVDDKHTIAMKIILSRKGFDSGYGGYASPIFPNGRLVSLPIPYRDDRIKYSDLKFDNEHTYYDLMKGLRQNIRSRGEWNNLDTNTSCHCDPDLNIDILKRNKHWQPCFGQNIQSQAHLANEGVKEDDLFLFFGWFRKVVDKNGIFQFDHPQFAPNLHVIFGYLQIGEIMRIDETTCVPECIREHPHAANMELRKSPMNTVYIARDSVSWNKNIPGAGVFNFDKKLVLTKKGLSRSMWDLPEFFKNTRISRHFQESWKKEGYLQTVPIGQEFIVDDNDEVENWAKTLIGK